MAWHFQIHNTITGRTVDTVHPSAGSWTRRLSGMGEGEHSFPLTAMGYADGVARGLFSPWSRTLVVLWDWSPVYAGIITGTEYDRPTGTVTVRHQELRSFFGSRLTFPITDYASGDVKISGKSPWGAVRHVLQRATTGAGRELPLDYTYLPDGVGDVGLDFDRYQVATIEDCLSAVQDLGYDIDFVPQFRGDHEFSWAPTVGKPLTTPGPDLDVTAEFSPVKDLRVSIDGAKQATGVFYSGNGTGKDMAYGLSPRAPEAANIPARELYVQGKDVRDSALLNKLADEELGTRRSATVQWSFGVDVSDDMSPLDVVPTKVVTLLTSGDPWLTDDSRACRVVALSADMGLTVTPEVQPR